MSLLEVSHLSFAYPGSDTPVFEDVSFRMDTDWRLGFTGRNGRGKTTFLQLLLGNYAYQGRISAQVTCSYFPYAIPPEQQDWYALAVAEAAAPLAEEWQVRREFSLLGLAEEAWYQPFGSLSQGEQTKVLLAALFLREGEFLLIDEPTNHLDLAGRQKLAAYLQKKQGFLLVSHDRTLLDACIDHILVIEKTKIIIQKGNFSSWWQNKTRQDQMEWAEQEKIKREVRRLSGAVQKTAAWSGQVEQRKYATKNSGVKPDRGYLGHQAAKLMKRSKTIARRQETMLAAKSKLLQDWERPQTIDIHPLPASGALVQLHQAVVEYDGKAAHAPVNLTVQAGQRLALQGVNGSGKSSILQLLAGLPLAYTGQRWQKSGLNISYLPQSAAGLQGTLADYAAACGVDETQLKTILRKFGFPRALLEQDMATFSSGQKKKVLLARSLCEEAHLYLWDEPLNFIDVITRLQLEELLQKKQPTMVFVEHDSAFCQNIATQVIRLDGAASAL